ncbi:tetratricopeptide repeat protein [Geobacillus sp. NFOSA3]|uniref:tetratricopeptide repeat protein n=1 Tax=Parageobacillus toebii TaxID=153151 RepID=UPI001492E51B|nr:bacteriocin-processing peptidase family protein [Parageobacillus toebii]MED4990335.1 tetratricopeptide repeat protein [Parageobacillus toebii]NNU93814.1 tetratricopeptide repeat protein [Geobacillus sp. NFOSA3]
MNIERIATYIKEKRIMEALNEIKPVLAETEKRLLFYWRTQLRSFETVEPFYHLIRLFDYALMYRHSAVLARYAHRRFSTLQTLTWVCDEWLEERRPLDIEEALRPRLEAIEVSEENREHVARAAFTLVRALLEMRRIEEAREWMQVVEQYETLPMYDKWGYFYIEAGDRDKAEEVLRKGLAEWERGDMCHLLLADLYALNGQHQKALEIVERGIERFPQVPALYVEKARRLRDLHEYEAALAAMDEVDRLAPYHVHRRYFAHARAQMYYKLGKMDELAALVQTEKSLASSPYARVFERASGAQVMLPIVPVVQKHNYCVPASLEMMLCLLGKPLTQDEIAEHIFDVRGSKLSTTVHYLETLGFWCRFFIGSAERWKRLIDEGIPVLLSVDYEHSSHVQVLFGYDERLGAFYVQDPNMLEPLVVAYDEVEKWYAGTHYLSIVAIPREKEAIAISLPEVEDQYFRQLHAFAEKMDEDEQAYMAPFLAFLREHDHIPYTWLYVVKHFGTEEAKELLINYTERVLAQYGDINDLLLVAAKAYVYVKEIERAEAVLARVKGKDHSPLYHYLRGRIAFYESRYEEASRHFRSSLQLDPDQPDVWSYMALSETYYGNEAKGVELSKIALSLQPDGPFVCTNHGIILFHTEQFQEARAFFDQLLRRHKREAHLWYERARCDEKLGKIRKAERGFLVAKALEEQEPYPYLALADLYEGQLDCPEKVESILLEGIKKAGHASILYVRLGDWYMEQEQPEKAETQYKKAIAQDETDVFAHLGMAYVWVQNGQDDKAKQYLFDKKQLFAQNSEFLLNAGKMLFTNGLVAASEDRDVAFSFLEDGLRFAQFDAAEAYEFYIERLIDHSLVERGITFLQKLVVERPTDINALCYLGVLYEQMGLFANAIRLYERASEVRKSTFPLYRLAETYRTLERFDEAKRYYEACLAIDETFTVAHLRLAVLYEIEENADKQRFHLKKALEHDPLHVHVENAVRLFDNPTSLIETIEAARAQAGDIWYYDSLGYVYGMLGELNKEKEAVEQALRIDSDHAELLHHYAKVLIKEGKINEAIAIIERLIEQDVRNEELYDTYIQAFLHTIKGLVQISERLRKWKLENNDKSLVYMYVASSLSSYVMSAQRQEEEGSLAKRIWTRAKAWTKQFFSAASVIDLYETAIRLDRGNMEAYERLAEFYEAGELFDDAMKTLRKALKYEWNAEVARKLVMLLVNADSSKLRKEAKEWIERLLEEQPNDLSMLELKALLLLDDGQEEKAERIFLSLIETDPLLYRSILALGTLYNDKQRYDEAIHVLANGLCHHPNDPELMSELARAYDERGQTEKALSVVEEWLRFDEVDLSAHYQRACYLAKLGRMQEAEAELAYILDEDETGYFSKLAKEEKLFASFMRP